MKSGAILRIGFAALTAALIGSVAGCSSSSDFLSNKRGWGSPPPNNGASVAAQQGAPTMVQTTGMRLTQKDESVKVPPWIRVQDCAVVAISTPSRYACPDGRVYTGTELYEARSGN
jgi:hypothetical protein